MEKLNTIVELEMFRPNLESIDRKERKSSAARKPTDRVRMFKMLALQNLHGLSDNAIEYQVTDRLTFTRFLGIDLGGAVPDAKTVWLLREQLREENETINEGAVPAQFPVADVNEAGDVAAQLQQRVHFHRGLGRVKRRLWEQRQRQIDRCGVQRVGGVR